MNATKRHIFEKKINRINILYYVLNKKVFLFSISLDKEKIIPLVKYKIFLKSRKDNIYYRRYTGKFT